jgi:hypothetical protein
MRVDVNLFRLSFPGLALYSEQFSILSLTGLVRHLFFLNGYKIFAEEFLVGYRRYSLLISNIRIFLNVLFFLLGDSSASELYVLTFVTLIHLHRWFKVEHYSVPKIQKPKNRQKERIQQTLLIFINNF